MKRIIIIVLLCFPALAFANPVITFESEAHNFGHVGQGAWLDYTFEFSNTGTDELIIQRISPP